MIKLKDILLEQPPPVKAIKYADELYKLLIGKRPIKVTKIKGTPTVISKIQLKNVATLSKSSLKNQYNSQIKWLESNKDYLYYVYPDPRLLKPGNIDLYIKIIDDIKKMDFEKLLKSDYDNTAKKLGKYLTVLPNWGEFKPMYDNIHALVKAEVKLAKDKIASTTNKGIAVERGTAKSMAENKKISNVGNASIGDKTQPDIWFTYKGKPYAFELKANWNARLAKFKKKENFSSFSFNRTSGKFEGTTLTKRGEWMLKKLNESNTAKNNMKNFFKEIRLPSDITTVNLFKSFSGAPNDKIIQNIANANKQILSPSKGGGVYWVDNAYIRKKISSRKAINGANESYIIIGDVGNQQIWHLNDDVLKLGTNLFEPPNIMLEAKFHSPSAKKSGKYYYGFLLDFKAQYIKKGDLQVQGGIPFNPETFLNK